MTSAFYGPGDRQHRRPRPASGSRRTGSSSPRTRRSRSSASGRSSRPKTTTTSTPAARPGSSSRATTAGASWKLNQSFWEQPTRPEWSPARAGCACTRSQPGRAIPSGLRSPSRRWGSGSPTTAAKPGATATRISTRATCPRRRARTRSRYACATCTAPKQPERLFMQFHGGVYRSDDAGGDVDVDRRRPPVRLRLPDGRRPGRPGQRVRDPARRGPGPPRPPTGKVRVYETRDAGETWIWRVVGTPWTRTARSCARRSAATAGRAWVCVTSARRPATCSGLVTQGRPGSRRRQAAAGALGARGVGAGLASP